MTTHNNATACTPAPERCLVHPRRTFLASSGLVVLSMIAIACGGDENDESGGACDGLEGTSTSDDGHTHALCVPASDLASPPQGGASYTTSSTGHTHTVTLSAADLSSLNAGGTVNVITSNDDGHTHQFALKR